MTASPSATDLRLDADRARLQRAGDRRARARGAAARRDRDAEVAELVDQRAVRGGRQQDVLRLDVAVHHVLGVLRPFYSREWLPSSIFQ